MAHPPEMMVRARMLRLQGKTEAEIATELSISTSTAHLWTMGIVKEEREKTVQKRDVVRKKGAQRAGKHGNRGTKEEKATRISNALIAAEREWPTIASNPLAIMSLGLWWGEGCKIGGGPARIMIGNTDPKLLMAFRRFLVSIGVDLDHICLSIIIPNHETITKDDAIKWWCDQLSISPSSIRSVSVEKALRKKEIRYPNGVATMYLFDLDIRIKIDTWTKMMIDLSLGHPLPTPQPPSKSVLEEW